VPETGKDESNNKKYSQRNGIKEPLEDYRSETAVYRNTQLLTPGIEFVRFPSQSSARSNVVDGKVSQDDRQKFPKFLRTD
jgi:hypothetical protein